MSYQNFKKAINLAKQCDGYGIGGAKSETIISRASEFLGFQLSKQNHEYFKEIGYLEFFGVEVYGICKDDFTGLYTGCAVEATLADRKEYQLPKEWLMIYFFDDGYMGYLDYGQRNEEGEPPVIMAIYNGEQYMVTEKVAEDLGDFLLSLVEEQLTIQSSQTEE